MIAFVVAFAVAVLGTPMVIAALHRWEMLDVPNQRSLHEQPVPRGGGIAVALATCVGAIAAGADSEAITALIVGALVLGIAGLLDDRLQLPAAPRLAVQVVIPLVAAVAVLDGSGPRLVVAIVVAVVASAGYVNAFNFMDGINGISGLQAVVGGGFLALLGRHAGLSSLELAGWAVVGASIGFLPYNVRRARIFLGDVGSYFLGFWLAGLALLNVDAGVPATVTVAPFLLYLLDTSTVIVRRARRGDPLTEAHREHAYQRLIRSGWSHLAVALLCTVVSAISAAIMYAAIDSEAGVRAVAFVGCLTLNIGYLALPSLVERTNGGAATMSA